MSGLGDPLGDFELPDLEGRRWSRADLHGSPTVLFCFATW
ncbi:MAG: peroxiredoxin family protein [Actinomycetota bacterium]|nr:peroxiredoxin family protein [Actinomycetota bacterium]